MRPLAQSYFDAAAPPIVLSVYAENVGDSNVTPLYLLPSEMSRLIKVLSSAMFIACGASIVKGVGILWIEELFGDFKKHDCDLELIHLRHVLRLQCRATRLLLVYLTAA